MDTFAKVVGAIVLFVLAVVVVGLLLSLPVMWLWNACLVGAVAGVAPIGWLQAWGLLVLFSILFKSTNTSTSKSS